eukprot:COSAG05_NODE_725_length_7716_cov_46.424314_5_plen_80_part_00
MVADCVARHKIEDNVHCVDAVNHVVMHPAISEVCGLQGVVHAAENDEKKHHRVPILPEWVVGMDDKPTRPGTIPTTLFL